MSTNPSIRLAGLTTDLPLAISGIVPVKAVGPVERGDLLTTSASPGHAMACRDAALCFGAVLGKAMEGLVGAGPGTIRVMVTLG